MPSVTHACGGTWEPMFGWVGRYRCARCGVIGAKLTANNDARGRPDEIIPYKCTKRVNGAPCGKSAVCRKPRQLCAEHRTKT